MGLLPVEKMWDRVGIAKQESDTAFFFDLLYLSEMVMKLAVLSIVAAVADDRDRHRYRLLHRLVRADGLGEWSMVLDDALTGPAAQHIIADAEKETRQLTEKCSSGTWQYDATVMMHKCLTQCEASVDALPVRSDARRWFSMFAQLRNATRGHGAPSGATCSTVCVDLEKSIRILYEQFAGFQRPWAYLHRKLSGRYRVTGLTDHFEPFDHLRSVATASFVDGIYIFYDKPIKVDLVDSDSDASDFFFPNGKFNGKKYEMISYVSNSKKDNDASSYVTPATELPLSETHGMGILGPQGKSFGNLPARPVGYIHRLHLEEELTKILVDDRHPVITLRGRGGIGKTSLALTVLHDIAASGRFMALIWFSARDIDLLPEGPKVVKPSTLTEKDIADEFADLMGPQASREKGFKSELYLAQMLQKSDVGPILFVFDNFETVRNPTELYSWLDAYVRLPNKILITTRYREFKADWLVEVAGMSDAESDELINEVSEKLGISHLIAKEYRKALRSESDGHPYVIKILLGEVAKAGRVVKIDKIVAGKEEILDALFERTYSGLSPAAKRVFLTLCNWRSAIPQLAIEAVVLRPANEKMDVEAAIEELYRSSFLEIATTKEDDIPFLKIPLAASIFGQKKLIASPLKSAIEADRVLLHTFGATQLTALRLGVTPHVKRVFAHVAKVTSSGEEDLRDHIPMLEFIARKHPPAWLSLASLYEESNIDNNLELAKEAVRRFIESTGAGEGQVDSWRKLAALCQMSGDTMGELQALLELSKIPAVDFRVISDTVNRVNLLHSRRAIPWGTAEMDIIVNGLTSLMEERISEAHATDCSRLGWLWLSRDDTGKAAYYAERGLKRNPDNTHCINLYNRVHRRT